VAVEGAAGSVTGRVAKESTGRRADGPGMCTGARDGFGGVERGMPDALGHDDVGHMRFSENGSAPNFPKTHSRLVLLRPQHCNAP
jgi:hypothetical protein